MNDVYFKVDNFDDWEPVQALLADNGLAPMMGKGLDWMVVDVQFVVNVNIDVAKIIAALAGLAVVLKGPRTIGLIIRGLGERQGRYRIPNSDQPAQLPEATQAAFKDYQAGAAGDRTWADGEWN